jgi:hypothetical protein
VACQTGAGPKTSVRNSCIRVLSIYRVWETEIEFYEVTSHSSDSHEYRREKVSTLLHEFVHAYLDMYSCYGCSDLWDELGKGHGEAFLDTAMAVSDAAYIRLGLREPLGEVCTSSLAREILDGGTGGKVPDNEALALWGISRDELDEQLEFARGSRRKRATRQTRKLKYKTIRKIGSIYLKLIVFYTSYKLPSHWTVMSSE